MKNAINFSFTGGGKSIVANRGVARNFLCGTKEGVCHPVGSRVRAPVGVGVGGGAKSQKPETNFNFQLRRGDMHPCPRCYVTVANLSNFVGSCPSGAVAFPRYADRSTYLKCDVCWCLVGGRMAYCCGRSTATVITHIRLYHCRVSTVHCVLDTRCRGPMTLLTKCQ